MPDGWTGKPWACQQLADRSDGDILLFVDADTWFEPDVLCRTAGLMQREQPGLFSVLPRQVAGTFAERLVLPGLYMIFLCGVPLWRLEASTHPDVAAANGQFICMWAQEYRRIAGHRGVQDLVVEDIALARNIKRGGGFVIARTAISSVHCRMYRSNRAVFDGFSKNAYASFDERPERVLISILVMLATHIVPIWLLVRGVLNRKNLGALHLVLPALEVGLGMLLRLIVSQRMGFRHLDAVLAQLNALAYVVITARSMWWRYVGGGYQWKGRRYLHAGSVR